jgi:aminoglycoside/choline kinase family phosphotransferase
LGSLDQRRRELIEWINSQDGFEHSTLEMVSGDASFRRYFRFQQQQRSVIAVDAPPEFENSRQFVEVAQSYAEIGLPVPEIYCFDFDKGFYCQQDFGNVQFSAKLNDQTADDLYQQALALLPVIQQCTATQSGRLPEFDNALLEREFYLFSHWLIEVHLNLSLSPQELADMQSTFSFLTEQFLQQPQVGVHRDYHSRNLMLIDKGSVAVIDFQDAVLGPITYDAVSLLRDCYQQWPSEKVQEWLSQFHQRYYSHYPWQDFKRWFDITGMQRHIKASGIFARLCHRDGKATYLKDVPATLRYIIDVACEYPQCEAFGRLVANKILPAVESKNQ